MMRCRYLSALLVVVCAFAAGVVVSSNKDENMMINEADKPRRLQFENMFENNPSQRGNKGRKKPTTRTVKLTRSQMLTREVEDILVHADRYHQWWTGPVHEGEFFKPESWSAQHDLSSAEVIFTMAVIQGRNDSVACSSPNDLHLYLGTARKVHQGDIVIALEADTVTAETKAILSHYRAVVYLLPKDLCSKTTDSIFCGSEEERVPASVFRFYFFEKWAAIYPVSATILITDFRDIIFQANPFKYHRNDWFPEFQLAVFQEFHPNMVIGRCSFNRRIMAECFGDSALDTLGSRIIVSSGAIMGTRDGIIMWSHHMTMQLQDAPGRQVETRCTSGGIDHSFINWLVYGNKLRPSGIRIRIYAHGEGTVNSLGGMRPDTVKANITGDIKSFWKVLSDDGHVLNWSGEVSPVVHQLDHFLDELIGIADTYISSSGGNTKGFSHALHGRYKPRNSSPTYVDRAWQAIAASQCLFDCTDSALF